MLNCNLYLALLPLIGVIVGGIITAGSNYLLEKRRDRAMNQRDLRNHAIEMKRAARLIYGDLSFASAAGSLSVNDRHWWSADVRPLTLEGWQQFHNFIVPELSEEAWCAVLLAVEAVDHLNKSRGIAKEYGLVEIDDKMAERIIPILKDIDAGRMALAPFVIDVDKS